MGTSKGKTGGGTKKAKKAKEDQKQPKKPRKGKEKTTEKDGLGDSLFAAVRGTNSNKVGDANSEDTPLGQLQEKTGTPEVYLVAVIDLPFSLRKFSNYLVFFVCNPV